MSLSVTALRQNPRAIAPAAAEARERSIRRRVNAVWGLLFLNTLVFIAGGLVHIPSLVGKGVTQGALPLAILIALTINPKIRIRPNVFLCLLSLLVLDTVITAALPQHLGTVYRTFRFAEFVLALWLLTPWWGRRDMLLLRCHLRWLLISLGTVLLGLVIAPGHALQISPGLQGRLAGVIWPMEPTQVAQYAAVSTGLIVLLWFARLLSGRTTLLTMVMTVPILLLTHTRTALAALLAGLLLAGLSLFTVNARVRKFFAASLAVVSVALVTAASVITTWLARGENARGLTSLTGRTSFWALVAQEPRTRFQEIFGFGLSNVSVNGLPIDSNWFGSYQMEGLFGVVVCAAIVVWLFTNSFFQPRGVQRALALFLITYGTVSSFTEVGFTDVSTYTLNLVVAAALLMSPLARESA
jgi:hypothetical protein